MSKGCETCALTEWPFVDAVHRANGIASAAQHLGVECGELGGDFGRLVRMRAVPDEVYSGAGYQGGWDMRLRIARVV